LISGALCSAILSGVAHAQPAPFAATGHQVRHATPAQQSIIDDAKNTLASAYPDLPGPLYTWEDIEIVNVDPLAGEGGVSDVDNGYMGITFENLENWCTSQG